MTEQIEPIVDQAWLAERRDDVLLADVRWYLDGRSGYDAYLAGHLPGAVWVDLDSDLSGPPAPGEGNHPLLDPATFAERLGGLGIGDDTTVVAYDDSGGGYAARLVWLLRRLGGPAALLDGGTTAWTGPLETGPVTPTPRPRTAVDWPAELIRSADEVGAGSEVLLDARDHDRFTGAAAPAPGTRPGHVPGARSAPWRGNLADDGRFADDATLRARYAALGVTEDTDVVVYCGSGVTACHDLLALERIGVRAAALYPGSWSAWGADPAREAELGDVTPTDTKGAPR
ncbi:sulfurtransferase [Pseudonocardia endophytica]|uniref:Thiosulfate/3-mercaptopyruvate sulfurtransferase n=1 Tax=Pseudonocardia endophytica TaxID=401976 RepID=A0A4R1HQN3_PSEEN|nr:sulfurtransferase [Pseudonocardia endophytica]TCK22069.1 thiosulfate/3-mercaptopyruvate sulfurtransferase [Pseudonocardia endophytica]